MEDPKREMTRRDFGKTLATGVGSLGLPAMFPVTQVTSLPNPKGGQQRLTLENKFGISVAIDGDAGQYQVLLYGKPWVGKGIVSVLVDKQWYRSGTFAFFEQNGNLPVNDFKSGSDTDAFGKYEYVTLSWKVPNREEVEFLTDFKLYLDNPYLIFAQRFPKGFKHYTSGDWTIPSVIFPQFVSEMWDVLNNLYSWTCGGMWTHRLAYGDAYTIQGTVDFLLLADAQLHSFILSPFSNYLVATQQCTPETCKHDTARGVISCGIEGLVEDIPPGYEHLHILVVGDGIYDTFRNWGKALLGKTGKKISRYQDDTLKYFVYMDDAGAYYYEHDFKEASYKSYEDIVVAIEKEARAHGLRIGAYHILDYPHPQLWKKGLFEPRPDMFPHGLTWLHEQLEKPLQLYTTWLRPDSPYAKKYRFFATDPGSVPGQSMGDVFYSEKYWKYTAEKIASWGGILLQHDYLSTYEGNVAMMSGISKMNIYFKNMAEALQGKGIDIQYCMALPRNIMQSTENPVMVSLQGTEDHHVSSAEPGWNFTTQHVGFFGTNEGDRGDPFFWKQLIFTSALYGALGIWPSRDNIQTIADPNAYEDTLLANLIGGSIQLGHRLGECNYGLLRKAYREGDGLIFKPDRPIVPLDRCYIDGGAVGYTESVISGKRWFYVLSLPAAGYIRDFSPSDLHIAGRWAVYDWEQKSVSLVAADSAIPLTREVKHQYFVLAPVLENGMAVFGDTEKWVSMADKRMAFVESSDEQVRVGVISNRTHSPIVTGYSPDRPREVEISSARLIEKSSLSRLMAARSGWYWDYQTKLWFVKIDFDGAADGNMKTESFSIFRKQVS